MSSFTMAIDGMTCSHCVGAVQKALGTLDGVQVEHVVIGSAVVTYDPAKIAVDAILAAVAEEGYPTRTA